MEEKQALGRAREAIQQGSKAEAQRLLYQILRANPRNETAWLWLSAIIGDPSKERECLERVLGINPDNATARHHLAELNQPETLPRQSQPSSTNSQTGSASSAATAPKGASRKVTNYLVVGSLLVMVFGCLSMASMDPATGDAVGTAVYGVVSLLTVLGGLGFIGGLILSSRRRQAEMAATGTGGTSPDRTGDRGHGTVIRTYASEKRLTTGQRRERLERVIGDYVGRGYQVTSQTDTSAQLVKKKQFSCLSAIILLFTVFGWILYLIYYWSQRDELVYLYVDEHGNVSVH